MKERRGHEKRANDWQDEDEGGSGTQWPYGDRRRRLSEKNPVLKYELVVHPKEGNGPSSTLPRTIGRPSHERNISVAPALRKRQEMARIEFPFQEGWRSLGWVPQGRAVTNIAIVTCADTGAELQPWSRTCRSQCLSTGLFTVHRLTRESDHYTSLGKLQKLTTPPPPTPPRRGWCVCLRIPPVDI